MSKQFSLVATDADMRDLEHVLLKRGDVTFLSTKAMPGTTELAPLNSIVLPIEQVGKQSLFCFLAPRNMPANISVRKISDAKVSVDIGTSHVIDFWRSFYDGRVVKSGRMFYENINPSVDERAIKDPLFCQWADSIMNATKKIFPMHKGLKMHVGADAAKLLEQGRIFVNSV
jgi:hypothetical protein